MNHDPFLYDHDRLATIASESVIKKGLLYFNQQRVIEPECDGSTLFALVEGSDPDWPYRVELTVDADGGLNVQCGCLFDHEPVCKHAIALLYSHAASYLEEEEASLSGAVDEALLERVRKGRNEVIVKQLEGSAGFGTWQASSIASSTYWKQRYQVQIRSLEQRMNYCTCPDWAGNLLGTCKHIEAVLHTLRKQPDYPALKEQGALQPFIWLAWQSATEPSIRLHRVAGMDESLIAIVAPFFDPSDAFSGQLPEDFFRLAEALYGRDDIQLGEDALRYARQCAADAASALRAENISREIIQSGGRLPGIRARLYPYQVEGVAFLASRGRALLADDMGLGKTLQAIAAADWMARNDEVRRILVICPASLKHQWAREIGKFTGHSVQVIQGGADARNVQYRSAALFVVVNYELVLRDLSVINATLRPDLLILDEAQRIKNWQTKVASTIKLITTRYAFVLTGTPLENRLEDLYSLLQVIDARVLGPLWRCKIDFHVTDERGKVIGYRNLSELRRRIGSVMLRRDRTLVSDQLPERTEVRLDLPMTTPQLELHDDAMKAAGLLANIAKRRPLTPGEQKRLMAALQKARMACNAAGLVDKMTEGSPKLDELARLLEELCLESNRKVVIFSQWERMTAMVESVARTMKIGAVRLHGGVPTNSRGALMDRFRDDDAIQLFISTDAGGVGLNLQAASVLINLDMPWNPAVLDQRFARVHRLGQQQKVQIFLLMAKGSYEERVAELVMNKRDLFDNVIRPDADKDVVGVSKKMLELIVDSLAEPSMRDDREKSEQQAELKRQQGTLEPESNRQDEREQDEAVRQTIERVQQAFGSRIERIFGAAGGLLVVVDRVDAESEATAAMLSDPIVVALIEPQILNSLQRLGAGSPVAERQLLFQADEAEQVRVSPFIQAAKEKLQSAELLIEQQVRAGVVELLCAAMLTAVAGKTDAARVLSTDEATVWIHAEALPQGLLQSQQANALTRAIALSSAPALPDELLFQLLDDARIMIAELDN